MKRTISIIALILAALMLMTAFAACGSSEEKTSDEKATEAATEAPTEAPTEEPKLEGTYKLTDASGDSAEYFISLKDTIKLTIDSNNIGTLDISGVSSVELVFDTETGKATSNGSETPFTFDGKILKLEDEVGMMKFTKE